MPPGVVGREAQLLEVERFLDASAAGFAVLVLEGDAGIGKTTLWREARSRAGERGALVLSSRPSAAEAKLSFAALADLLARVDGDAFAALPGPQRDAKGARQPSGRRGVPHPDTPPRGRRAGDPGGRRLAVARPTCAGWSTPPGSRATGSSRRRARHGRVKPDRRQR